MHERERKRLLGQWGVRGENDRERREREVLERELHGAPFRGRRVHVRGNPFGPAPDRYVVSLGGPLPYMVRLREIDAAIAAHERALEEAWRESAGPSAWRRTAERWNFVEVNDLIERHNRWYPVESGLPMDPRRRNYALVNGEDYRRRTLDAAWILERFPPG